MPDPDDDYLGPIRVISKPGVKRDGTELESEYYVDALWMRIEGGLPRKINGYRVVGDGTRDIVRALHGQTKDLRTYLHQGSAQYVESCILSGVTCSGTSDRTPVAGFTPDPDNMWQFDAVTDGGTSYLVAQVAPNLDCICSSDAGALFTGDLYDTAPLTQVTTLPSGWDISGGVVVLHPYTVALGQNGYVAWSVPNDPHDFTSAGAGNAYVTRQKMLRGMPLRNGPGNNPAGLLWSADSLLQMSYVGGTPIFDFSHLSSQISVLGQNTIIEYDGVFYWVGTDRFLMFNGVVRDVPNDMNRSWFFDNINMQYRQKCFAFRAPRRGEIWWCFPYGDATECTHAVIYNTREQIWYDTELPDGGRSAGLSPVVYPWPILTGTDAQTRRVSGASVSNGGAGYTIGDTLTVSGGTFTTPAQLTVVSMGGGLVTVVGVAGPGAYSVAPTNPVSVTGGTGSGALFDLTCTAPYQVWIHENGLNKVVGGLEEPVRSYFKTGRISLPVNSGENYSLIINHLEPDFEQDGEMTVKVYGRYNARSPESETTAKAIVEPASDLTADEQTVKFKFQARHLWLEFESNVLDGDYRMGHVLANLSRGDERMRG